MRMQWVALLMLLTATAVYASSEEADVYFNAGTEKYLQGRFSDAVADLEKAQQLDPANTRINGFMAKILLEAATQNHLNRKYSLAMAYITKARAIDPGNEKVEEMYRLTSDVLNKPGPAGRSETHATTVGVPLLPSERSAAAAAVPAAAAPRPVVARQASAAVRRQPAAVNRQPAPPVASAENVNIQVRKQTVLLVASAGSAVLFFLLFLVKARRLRHLRRSLASARERIAALENDATATAIEREKLKERLKYEHQAVEQARRDLGEKNRREEERIKAELDLRTQQAEERIRAELAARHLRPGAADAFLHQQQAKFLQYLGDSSSVDDVSSPVLESTRERIGMMAENLYAYAPGAAVDFLHKMAVHGNPLVRANVIRALARIARPETIDLLVTLSRDADPRVKREVLKTLKQLHQQIITGDMLIGDEDAARIAGIIAEERKKGEWIM